MGREAHPLSLRPTFKGEGEELRRFGTPAAEGKRVRERAGTEMVRKEIRMEASTECKCKEFPQFLTGSTDQIYGGRFRCVGS